MGYLGGYTTGGYGTVVPPPVIPYVPNPPQDTPGASYRYLFADLLTNEVNLEVPLYGVSYNRLMNASADCTFSINLDRTGYSNQDVIGGTQPGKTALYIERNGGLIWGGVVWSRTYQSQAKVFTYTGQSFESYFGKIVIESDLVFKQVDQRNILCELFLYAQQKLLSGIDVQVPLGYPFTTNSIPRSVSFYKYDTWTVQKAIEHMIEYDQGFDYTIDVFYDDQGNPAKRLNTDNVLGQSVANTGLVFSYPGNVTNYYWPENASRGAVSVIGSGAGDGADKILSRKSTPALLNAGYPDLQEVYSNQDVSVKSTLDAQTAQEATRLRPPISVPTIELDPGTEPKFGSWGLGDYAILELEDARFPDSFTTTVRVIGYEASPPTSEGPESCKVVLEGDADA